MYVTNVFDFDNMTDDSNDTLSLNNICTMNENNIVITIATSLLTIPCGLSFSCLMSFLIYTLPHGLNLS